MVAVTAVRAVLAPAKWVAALDEYAGFARFDASPAVHQVILRAGASKGRVAANQPVRAHALEGFFEDGFHGWHVSLLSQAP